MALAIPKKKMVLFSVSGNLNDFTMVGTAANASATILKKIAILPTLVITQSINPKMDKAPHMISSLEISHVAFLLKKDATKITKGKNPTVKVANAVKPTPCFIMAKKAIIGAILQSNQLTLFGFTRPFNVSTK